MPQLYSFKPKYGEDECQRVITIFVIKVLKNSTNCVLKFLLNISNLAKPSENFWKLVKSVSLKCLLQTLPSSVHPGRFLVLFIKVVIPFSL